MKYSMKRYKIAYNEWKRKSDAVDKQLNEICKHNYGMQKFDTVAWMSHKFFRDNPEPKLEQFPVYYPGED